VDLLLALAPPGKPPGRERKGANYTVRSPERIFTNFCRALGWLDDSARSSGRAASNFHLQNDMVRLYSTLRSEFLN
jgi:hypothetical protein